MSLLILTGRRRYSDSNGEQESDSSNEAEENSDHAIVKIKTNYNKLVYISR